MASGIILELQNLSKNFPGVKALDDVSFSVRRGRVHALVGENGAGKSTLIKALAGIYQCESGNILLDGKTVRFAVPHDAQTAGVSVVHQELKLSETLSVTENIFLGNLLYSSHLVDWKSMRRKAKEMIHSMGIDIDVDATVDTLSVSKKQIVEICKAITYECKLLIMDEPSATLTEKELNVMFDIIEKLRRDGITIIYISHRLDEIFRIADDVTVLRDGKHIHTGPVSTVNRESLIKMMVGREIAEEYPKETVPIGEVVLEVKHVNRKGVLKDISFSVRRGEVLGIAGLVGAGRTELARAILGIDKIDSGEILLHNKPVRHKNFREAIANRFGLIPEDRKKQGLVQIMSVEQNITLVSIQKILKTGVLRKKLERDYAQEYTKKLKVVAPSVQTEVQFLSGGNQQKVVIAKWLLQESEIIFLDEPTRGIDVGAKAEIYRLISDLVREGKTVIAISSDLPEVLGISDRILVLHGGEVKGILSRSEASQEKIMSYCV